MRSLGPWIAASLLSCAGIFGAGAASAQQSTPERVQLLDLFTRTDALKEDVRRSHTRLALLCEDVLGVDARASEGEFRLRNDLGMLFELESIVVVIDGVLQLRRRAATSGNAIESRSLPVYDGFLAPGPHTVQIVATLRGSLGYLRAYRFEVRSSHSFTAIGGKKHRITALLFERGDALTPFEERPAVRFQGVMTQRR